jgi:hypothetical protein
MDLALLEGKLDWAHGYFSEVREVDDAAQAITADRPKGQIASIAGQLEELVSANVKEKLGFKPDWPVAIGLAGGRLRIAFMHPDMVRFFGPAWQMPIGAGDADAETRFSSSRKKPTTVASTSTHGPKYRESVNFVPSDNDVMYPGEEVSDWHSYEGFGTRMSETLLLSLGYFSDQELEHAARRAYPCPRLRCGSATACVGRLPWSATPSRRCARCARGTWARPYRNTSVGTASRACVSCARAAFRRAASPVRRR